MPKQRVTSVRTDEPRTGHEMQNEQDARKPKTAEERGETERAISMRAVRYHDVARARISFLRLKVGRAPGARVGGEIVYFRAEPLELKDTEAVVRIVMAQRFGVTVSAAALRDMDVSWRPAQRISRRITSSTSP